MRKKFLVFLGVAAIIALAAINLNIALKSDFTGNVTLASMESLAKGEGPGGSGGCPTTTYSEIQTYPSGKIASMCVHSDCGSGGGTCEAFCWWESYDEGGAVIGGNYDQWSYAC